MINNSQVLDYTKQYLLSDIEFIENTNNIKINRFKKQLKLQRKTIWGDLVKTKISICQFFDKVESVALPCLGVVVTISSLYTVMHGVCAINPSLRPIVLDKIEEILKTMSVPFFITLPAVLISILRGSIKNNFENDDATKQFFDNHFIQNIMRTY